MCLGMSDFKREVGCTLRDCVFGAGFWWISASINTNTDNNIHQVNKKLCFPTNLLLFLVFSYHSWVFIFHSRNPRGFAVPGELLGLAWPLLPGECHPIPHHEDLQGGTAVSDIWWHVGNRRAEQLHPAVSDKSPWGDTGTSATSSCYHHPCPFAGIPPLLFLMGIPRLSLFSLL